ncbi:NAD(P)H-binding protein [Streptomyces sp. NPDC005071]
MHPATGLPTPPGVSPAGRLRHGAAGPGDGPVPRPLCPTTGPPPSTGPRRSAGQRQPADARCGCTAPLITPQLGYPITHQGRQLTAASNLVLIPGASGVCRTVFEQLRAQDVPVRFMVRTEDERAAELRRLGAEVVIGDLNRPETVAAALRGDLCAVERAHVGLVGGDDPDDRLGSMRPRSVSNCSSASVRRAEGSRPPGAPVVSVMRVCNFPMQPTEGFEGQQWGVCSAHAACAPQEAGPRTCCSHVDSGHRHPRRRLQYPGSRRGRDCPLGAFAAGR